MRPKYNHTKLSLGIVSWALLFALSFALSNTTIAEIKSRRVVSVSGGSFSPFYQAGAKASVVKVMTFKIDRTPVTNNDFELFIEQNTTWRPGAISPLLAEKEYLSPLQKNDTLVPDLAPVTYVSWFAARAYCKSKGGRLPTNNEWEYVASANETKRDASRDPHFVQQLLAWYGAPQQSLRPVGQLKPNVWGVYDLHGLVWEWVEDFNSVFVAGDNRRDGDDLKNMYCASGATTATDRANYAAFMRYALRSSLQGNFVLKNLGFRCAYDLEK